jgi:hypothetical protein
VESDVDRYLEEARKENPDTIRSEISWPDYFPALAGIGTDGYGFLYVFPYLEDFPLHETVPVDVYSPGGERVFSGMIDNHRWTAARGDHVYRIGIAEGDREYRVWRYKLSAPFWQ